MLFLIVSGRFTGEEVFINSHSPLYETEILIFIFCWNFILCILTFCVCDLSFCAFWRFAHFRHFTKVGPHGVMCIFIGVGLTPIIYIYSLRHFLTTKGALIDGDGYPPLPPLKWPQKWPKIDQNSLKFSDKKWSKTVFLNGKSHFFTKITLDDTKNSQKWSKIGHKLVIKIRS